CFRLGFAISNQRHPLNHHKYPGPSSPLARLAEKTPSPPPPEPKPERNLHPPGDLFPKVAPTN
ncbi:MAG: hypothetical protein NT049_15200, partial [Planctomycetota bacterium]|nr:hypothetical protein [Planctomycetota bacterium]